MIAEVRPRSTDVIIVEERRLPRPAIENVTVPLNAERVACLNMPGESTEHEPRIIRARREPLYRTPADNIVQVGRPLIAKQQYSPEFGLADRSADCVERSADGDTRYCNKRDVPEDGALGCVAQAPSSAMPRRYLA